MVASDKLRALASRIRREPTPIKGIVPLLDEAATEAETLRARVAALETVLRDVSNLLDEPKVPMSASVRSVAVKEMRDVLSAGGSRDG